MRIPVAGSGRLGGCTKGMLFLEDQRFPETRPKGDYVCANTRGIRSFREKRSSPFSPSSPIRSPSSFRERLSRDIAVSLIEAPAFRRNIIHLFPREDRTRTSLPGSLRAPSPTRQPCSCSCDITNVFGIRRGGSIDSVLPNGNASLTFALSYYKADIEWLPAYVKSMHFPSLYILQTSSITGIIITGRNDGASHCSVSRRDHFNGSFFLRNGEACEK